MAITIRQRVTSATVALSVFGLAITPAIASAVATDTKSTTITADVGSTITMTTSSSVTFNVTPVAGGAVTSSSDTVVVNTNSALGYNLKLANNDTNTNLVSGANNIAATGGTFASPQTLGNNTWGYRIVGLGGFGASAYSGETNQTSSTSTWAPVPSSVSPTTLKSTGGPASNDTTTVWYGVKVTTAQPTGAYTDSVVYTATTN